MCGLVLVSGGCKRDQKEQPETKEATASKETTAEMSLDAQKHVGLTVAPALLGPLDVVLTVTGTVQPIDSRIGQVSPLARGRLLEVRAKVGDRVLRGQTLALFDNIDAIDLFSQQQTARAELARLEAQRTVAQKQVERSRHLADIGAGAEKDYESSRAEAIGNDASIRAQQAVIDGLAQRLRRYGAGQNGSSATSLRSPLSGVVTKAPASPGDVLEAGQDAFTVADLSHVWVQAEVYEKDLGRVRLGQNATVHVDTYPTESFVGRVAYISDVLDPQTRTARVRCEVENGERKLKTDMFASVELPTNSSKQAITVPTDALQTLDGKPIVFVQQSATSFLPRALKIGIAANGRTEVLSGLHPGERIVTQGAFHLKSILAVGSMGDED
jgi:cobalt-zinc-cadmium efflux system membrane fusion protein